MYKDPDKPCQKTLDGTLLAWKIKNSFISAYNGQSSLVLIAKTFPALIVTFKVFGQILGLLQCWLCQLGVPIGVIGVTRYQCTITQGIDIMISFHQVIGIGLQTVALSMAFFFEPIKGLCRNPGCPNQIFGLDLRSIR